MKKTTCTATLLRTSVSTLTIMAMLASNAAFALDGAALPTGGSVAQGSATLNYSATQPRLDVHQHTQQAVLDWNTFNIGNQATTQFHQPNSAAVAVNRVHDVNPSQIMGTLRGNGNVVVLNTNGVVFGHGATVDVGGLVVSTGTLDADLFQNTGQLALNDINTGGSIVNNGAITVAQGGLAAFVAPHVVNNGSIRANLGKVVLAGGADRATVDLYGDKLVELALDENASKAVIENTGLLQANGGTVEVTVAAAQDIVDSVVNLGGVVEANAIDTTGGKIVLKAQNADIVLTGEVNAKGDAGDAGTVEVKTNRNIYVAEQAKINADAGANGNGGKVDVVAQQDLYFYGVISARGGSQSGNGGAVDTSGFGGVDVLGLVDAGAVNGTVGTWLIDPRNIVISNDANNVLAGTGSSATPWIPGSGSLLQTSRINVGQINTALNNGTSVYITTVASPNALLQQGNITVDAAILKSVGNYGAELFLSAHNNITFTANGSIISTKGALNVDMVAGGLIQAGVITTRGGNLSLVANGGGITLNGAINTGGGNAIIDSAGGLLPSVNFNNVFETKGGDLWVDASLNINVNDGAEVITTGNAASGPATGKIDLIADGFVTINGLVRSKGDLNVDSGILTTVGETGSINTNGSDARLYSEIAVIVNGVVNTRGGNLLAQADGLGVLVGETGTIDTGTPDGSAFGNASLIANTSVTVNGAVRTKGGNFLADAGLNIDIGETGVVNAGAGTADFTAGNNVNVDGKISTDGAAILISAGNGLNVGAAQGLVQSAGGDIDIYADAADIRGAINAADGVLTIGRNDSVGRIILGDDRLGGMMPKLHLTQAEIDNLAARKLVVGRDTGNVDNDIVVDGANLRGFDRAVLQTRSDAGYTQEVQFLGDNKFARLNVRADDGVIFWSDSENAATGKVNIRADADKDGQGDVFFDNYSLLKTNGDDITIKTNALTLSAGVINANGGNIDIVNFDRFYSSEKNSLRTEGTGSIWLTQFSNGSIQNAVDAFHNTGDGENILYLEPGVWTEQVRLTQKNFVLQGSGAGDDKGSTIIEAPADMDKFNVNGERIAAVISVRGVENVRIADLTVDGADAGGLQDNNVDRFVGIAYYNASGAIADTEIKNMTGGDNGGTGLFVVSDDGIDRDFTTMRDRITGFERDGVYAAGLNFLGLGRMKIDGLGLGDDGVNLTDITTTVLAENRVRNVTGDGFDIDGAGTVIMGANRIVNAGVGIYLDDVGSALLISNRVRNTNIGIEVEDTSVLLVDNRIRNTTTGLFTYGDGMGDVVMIENRFVNNTTGARFQAGNIVFLGKNRFIGGVDGLIFDGIDVLVEPTESPSEPPIEFLQMAKGRGSVLSIEGDALGETVFRGQSGNYVALYNGALAGEFIDASNVKFDGATPDFANQAAINAIEAKLVDFDDDNGVGQILSILPTPAAVNSPQPGDITQILPWQFLLQLGRVNGGSLTITGLPFAPGSIPASFLAGLDSAAGGPMTPEQLNNLDSAAGGDSANCWGDVYNKMGSGAVTFNFGGSPGSLINAQSSCGI